MATLMELRIQNALSQRDLGRMADLDQSTINRLEKGYQKPTHQTRRKLAKALEVKPSEIEF